MIISLLSFAKTLERAIEVIFISPFTTHFILVLSFIINLNFLNFSKFGSLFPSINKMYFKLYFEFSSKNLIRENTALKDAKSLA